VSEQWLVDIMEYDENMCGEQEEASRSLDQRVLQKRAAAPARPTAIKLLCCVLAPLPMQFVQIDGVAEDTADRLGELYADAPVAVALVMAVPAEGMVDV
jgi:hypothetical protein